MEVPGGPVPLLALPLIHVGFDGVPVGPMERRVPIEDGLHVVVPRRDFRHALERVAPITVPESRAFSRAQAVHVTAEDLRRRRAPEALESGFGTLLRGDEEDDPAIHGVRSEVRREGDLDAARALLNDIKSEPGQFPGVAVDLELARIAFHQGDSLDGQVLIQSAYDQIWNPLDAALCFDEVKQDGN